MKDKEQKIVNLIMKSILAFPILTIIQGISIFANANKVLMAIVLFELIVSFKFLKYRKNDFIILFITLVIHLIAFYYTKERLYNFNMIFYLFVWVLFYLFCASQKEYIKRFLYTHKGYLKMIIVLWTAIIGISALIPSCYNRTGAFQSFADKSFRVMPSTLIITSLIMFLINNENKNKYKYYLLLLPATYTAMMGASRTYFFVFFILVFIHFYVRTGNKKQFWIKFIPILSLLIVLSLFTYIGDKIFNKIYSNNTYYDFWGNLTSGRTVFWMDDINAFFRLSYLQQIVGNGYNFVFIVNASHGYIWAHNDIINLLLNFGYIGVFVYVYAFFRMYNENKEKLSKLICFMYLLAIFLNSMFNMSYTYLCAFLSYPIFLFAFNEQGRKENVYN